VTARLKFETEIVYFYYRYIINGDYLLKSFSRGADGGSAGDTGNPEILNLL